MDMNVYISLCVGAMCMNEQVSVCKYLYVDVCVSMWVYIVCVWVFACIYVYVGCMITYMYVRMLDCLYMCVECMCHMYGICVRVSMTVGCVLQRSEPVR